MDKKAVLGLENVKVFIILILIVATISFVAIIALTSIQDTRDVVTTVSENESYGLLGDNATTATLLGTPTTLSAVRYNRTWLEFDGFNDKVNLPSGLFGFADGDNFTYAAWVNYTNISTEQVEVVFGHCFTWFPSYIGYGWNMTGEHNDTPCVGISHYGGPPQNYTCATSRPPSSTHIGQWMHIIGNYNGTGLNLYINGVLNSSKVIERQPDFTSSYHFEIGNCNTLADFGGKVDEVRVYNRTLTTTEITEIYNSKRIQNSSLTSEGLVLWLPINEGTGTDIHSFNQSDFT